MDDIEKRIRKTTLRQESGMLSDEDAIREYMDIMFDMAADVHVSEEFEVKVQAALPPEYRETLNNAPELPSASLLYFARHYRECAEKYRDVLMDPGSTGAVARSVVDEQLMEYHLQYRFAVIDMFRDCPADRIRNDYEDIPTPELLQLLKKMTDAVISGFPPKNFDDYGGLCHSLAFLQMEVYGRTSIM